MHALHVFGGGRDGAVPVSGALAPQRSAPYPQIIGTTQFGGRNDVGTVYGLTKSKTRWTEKLLYQFNGGTDGKRPLGIAMPKTLDSTSSVFVTSFDGGANFQGSVTVLKPNPNGTLKLQSLYSFRGKPDGSAPQGPPMEDASGDLYGTASGGGTHGHGAVYRMTPGGSGYSENLIYSFKGGKDGAYPYGGLIDVNGVLYGMTEIGGSAGHGSVFALTPSGSAYTESIVYSFKGAPDGDQPEGTLCDGPDGALYGTTITGGDGGLSEGGGTVFRVTPGGGKHAEQVIWNFGNFYHDGGIPMGSLIVNSQGVIYGTTQDGGGQSSGTFFVLTPKGSKYTEKLHIFNGANGAAPQGGPSADGNGNIYIATSSGGRHADGVVAAAKGTAQPGSCNPGSLTIGA